MQQSRSGFSWTHEFLEVIESAQIERHEVLRTEVGHFSLNTNEYTELLRGMNVYMNFPRIGSSASSSSGRDMPPLKGSQDLNMDPASRYQPPTSCDVQKEVESKVGDAPSSRKGCLNFRTGVGSPGTQSWV